MAIGSLKDLTDLKNLVSKDKLEGIKGDLTTMGEKMKDLGASLKDSDAAKQLMGSIDMPAVPNLDGKFSSLKDMMAEHAPTLEGLTGTGSGPLGVPSMQDFMGPTAGGAEVKALLSGSIDADAISNLNGMVTKSQGLFTAAGIDIAEVPKINLGTLMNAATSLHKIGAEANGAGSADILKQMIPTSGNAAVFGDAIKSAMAEGKNKAAMLAAGINPPSFNPMENLPSAPDNIGSQAAVNLLSGGG
jgi:hypothetical protein